MKSYIHSRLKQEDRDLLDELRRVTGESESTLVRKGLKLLYEREAERRKSVLALGGKSIGKFKKGPRDLSSNKKHLEGFSR